MNSPANKTAKSPDFAVNQILCGEAKATLGVMPANSVNLIITDPPYLCNYRDRIGRTIANDNNADGVLPAFTEMYRVLKPNSYCISFYGWNAVDKFSQTWTDVGFSIVGQIVWPKNYTSKNGFMAYQHESAFVLAKGRPAKPAKPIPDVQTWHYTGNRSHPTEKAVEIISPLIRSFSNYGDLVMDPFLGSGTTAVAAALNGRQYIGIELKQRYCQIAEKRLNGVTRYQTHYPTSHNCFGGVWKEHR